jgi:SP family xylose:H+ symportor-like MFS transporter
MTDQHANTRKIPPVIFALTLVATLGGLLFGYDTAVINGATEALRQFFITPLENDPALATATIIQFNDFLQRSSIENLAGIFVAEAVGSKTRKRRYSNDLFRVIG